MEGLLRHQPNHPWLTFYLGSLLWDKNPQRSAELYRTAAGLFAERRDALAEVRSRNNLYWQLSRSNQSREAVAQVERAVEVAERSGDNLAIARARILEASHLAQVRQDLERAHGLLQDAEARVFPDGPYEMQRDCRLQQANLALSLGRLDEARRLYRYQAEMMARQGDRYAEAVARYNLVRTLRDELALTPRPGGQEECLALARQALATAEAAGHREIVAKSHAVLGLLTRGEEARSHFERCFEAAEERKDKSYCRSALARTLAAEDPGAALRAVDEALALARKAEDSWAIAYSWRERMRVSWRLGPPEQAVRDSEEALDAIEVMRDLQAGGKGRAEVFSTWAGHYHWLAGRMLRDRRTGLAFGVQERMRARALIDALEAARVPSEDATLRRPGFATLDGVSEALAPDEALLSFQIAPWADMVGDFEGGAWLIVATRGGARIYPLRHPLVNRTQMRQAVEGFAGVLQRESDGEEQGAAALYQALLADGLAGLHPSIRRLVIVPDDALNRVPFAALRANPEGEPLAVRYEINLVPSATLWLRWQRERPSLAGAPALALADPDTPATLAEDAFVRATGSALPGRLGKLPGARREGKAMVRHLGGDSRLLMGGEASEAFIKTNGLGRYGILHFATHAWTDDVEPDRSFVLLSPGDGEKEDGFLQIREIVGLDLRGRIVVLSACSSASGEILRGEGVMGLARAFFQAGAHTVVASLWPLRDDYGAALFDRFYHYLGQGSSVSAALQAAQRDRMEDGAPAAAWAGVVVLGDGDRVPLPGGREKRWPLVAGGLAAVALLGVLGFLAVRRRRIRISP